MPARLTLLCFLCTALCSNISAQQALDRSLTHDGIARTYIVYVPQAYTGDEAWPLIISLHGYTGTAVLQRLISNFEALADEEHFLLAYPQGLEIDDPSGGILPALPPRGTGWNIRDPNGPDDLGFMEALMDSVSAEFNIDPARVFAAGHSNGGTLAYIMACELTGRIAAIASVGGPGTSPGLVPFFECNTTAPTPVIHIHGTTDAVVPYGGVEGLFPPIPALVESWGGFNGCAAGPVVTEIADAGPQDGSTATLIQYLDCEQDAEVWHFRVNGGGHWWPGSIDVPPFLESVFGKTNRDFDASREIWNFFTGRPATVTGLEQPAGTVQVAVTAFPNPFREEVSVAFRLQEAGSVRLRAYDPLGRPATVVPEQSLPAGLQQVQWETPPHLPAGWYLLVLEVDGVPVGRQLVIRK